MSLVFYFSPMSTATMTDVVIEELGVPHDRKRVDLRAGDNKKPEFAKLNPNMKVPTIVHDGVVIWESAAITMYLGEQFGVAKGLWPAAGPRRGEAMKWVVWTNVTLGEAVYRRGYNGDWAEPGTGNPKALEKANADIAELLGVLDGSLAGKQYLLGAEFTLADAHLNSFCDWLRHSKIDFAKYANVNAWSERCSARPAYKRVMEREGAEAKG
jgi:glutathione S-transferase